MTTVTYFDPPHSGDQPLAGEVWSPGPVKRSLWVRTPAGDWVVVQLQPRIVVHNPTPDPRFEPCPGHWRYVKGGERTWEPSAGTRMECARYCRDTARLKYMRLFRANRRDFTLAERARCAALFEIKETTHAH